MSDSLMAPDTKNHYAVESWFDSNPATGVDYFDYWNNEELEKEKEFYILDGDFQKMESYLQASGLVSDVTTTLKIIADAGQPLRGQGIDLASGNLWAVPYLLRQPKVERIYCLEFSKHRLLKIGPSVLKHYQVPPEKVVLAWGSFYDLRLKENSLDFAFLSAAFHHADKPVDLLLELKRVLKPGGLVLIIGEHRVRWRGAAKQIVKSILACLPTALQTGLFSRTFQGRPFNPRSADFMDVEPVLGDHEYTDGAYRRMFSSAGFDVMPITVPGSIYQSFLLLSRA